MPKRKRQIADLLKRGDEVLVQATKDPMGTKGVRLTMQLSLAGRFVVYVPFGEGIGRQPSACPTTWNTSWFSLIRPSSALRFLKPCPPILRTISA